MNDRRRFWDELLVAREESLAAFSGVNLDLIDAPTTIPRTCRRDGSRFSSSVQTLALSTGRQNSEIRSRKNNRGR